MAAAETLLRFAAERAPSADREAALVELLLGEGRTWAASERLAAALARFCVHDGGALATAAARLSRGAQRDCPGWFGLSPAWNLVGQVAASPGSIARVDLCSAGRRFSARCTAGREGLASFRFPIPRDVADVSIEVDGRRLCGSDLRLPPDFALEGGAFEQGGNVVGRARLGWDPMRRLELEATDDEGRRLRPKIVRGPNGEGVRFSIDVRKFSGRRIWIRARMPDGSWGSLPDAPVLCGAALRPVARAGVRGRPSAAVKASAATRRAVDVIVPVYAGRDETAECLRSVLDTVGREVEVIVVDDASPDPAIVRDLDALASSGRIRLVRNERNLGFTASVNRGMAVNPEHDVVLLNSDTRVSGNWLERLRAAAYREAGTATVTPWSDDGSIVSYRSASLAKPGTFDPAQIDRACAVACAGQSPEIPVGVGFCLFVRRDCLQQVGAFDEFAFTRGYGEETDFCLRAVAAGWRHRLAADVFVHHAGGRSFGRGKSALLERGGRIVNRRFPGYDRWIATTLRQDPLRGFRRDLDEHRLAALSGRLVLLVTLESGGGVDRHLGERFERYRAAGDIPVVLRPSRPGGRDSVTLFLDQPLLCDLAFDIPSELERLTRLLRRMPIARIEIHHFMGLDERVVDMLRALDVPYDAYVHDYVWICPRVTLIDSSRRYCGEPALRACETCVKRAGSRLEPGLSVARLRRRSGRWLQDARRVVAPSADVRDRLARYFPDVSIEVEALEPPVTPAPLPTRSPQERVRVALLGAIGDHKGYRVLLDCARDAARRDLPVEYVVIGYTADDERLLRTGKVFITGRYAEEEAGPLLARERPTLAFFPSVWPETWCYALTPALAAGLPVVAFDLGAIASRLRAHRTGHLLPLTSPARAINDAFLRIGAAGFAR